MVKATEYNNQFSSPTERFWFRVNKSGTIPKGMKVLHHCDNPLCVNPRHLFTGSYADNNRDRDLKERQSRGERVNTAVLTEEDVRYIRLVFKRRHKVYGGIPLGKKFGVTREAIRCAIVGICWKHVK